MISMLPAAAATQSVENPPIVLCIDNSERLLQVLAKILAPLPVKCLTTSHPLEAVEQARTLPVRLVILDWHLPPLDGWEVLRTIRAAAPSRELRVIILSDSQNSFENLLAINVAGADAYLEKPVEAEVFSQEVLRLLNLPLTGETRHA
jgi:CheY-like chemotaxis protein